MKYITINKVRRCFLVFVDKFDSSAPCDKFRQKIPIRKTETTNRITKERGLPNTVPRLQLELHRRNRKSPEDVRNVKQSKKGSNVAKLAWTQDHVIDFDNVKVIDKGNHRNLKLKTLESWHTALTDEADNNSNTLPAQYTILLRKEFKKH